MLNIVEIVFFKSRVLDVYKWLFSWRSTKYLCQFHVLQSQWRYLLLGEHNISATDRPALFQMVKTLMFAHTEDDLYEA